jgi:hypothetical protein
MESVEQAISNTSSHMPQELTPEQRLTQIEKLLESAVKLSHSNTAKINDNAEAIAVQDLKIDRLTEQVGRATEIFVDSMSVMRTMQTNIENMQTDIREMQTDIREMQLEIRGLQVENRRILDRFFGTDNPD